MAAEDDLWQKEAELKLKRMPAEAKELRELALNDLFCFARLVNPGYVYGDIHRDLLS